MQIFVYLTLRRNKTHVYTLWEAHTDVLKGWSTAFIANDKETKWIAKSNIASSCSKENGCSSCTLTVEKKLYYAFSLLLFPLLPASLPPSLLFLSVSVHHIANTTSPQYISLSDFIDLWPVMSQFASSTFIYAIPRTYTFWSKKRYSLLSAYGTHFAGTISSEKAVTQYMRLWQGIM